jgi:hypothetical protein
VVSSQARWPDDSRAIPNTVARLVEGTDGSLARSRGFCWIGAGGSMVPFFVQIKCQLGKSYEVANRLADAEVASEIYSTAGEFVDIGHFVNEKIQVIPGIQDTRTIITFKAF